MAANVIESNQDQSLLQNKKLLKKNFLTYIFRKIKKIN